MGPADFTLRWHWHWKLQAMGPPQAQKAHRSKEGDRVAMKIGNSLSSEEFSPRHLIEQPRAAERAGFQNLWISDHYHPWNNAEGRSPFV